MRLSVPSLAQVQAEVTSLHAAASMAQRDEAAKAARTLKELKDGKTEIDRLRLQLQVPVACMARWSLFCWT